MYLLLEKYAHIYSINIIPLQILKLPCIPMPFCIRVCLRFGYEDTTRVYHVFVRVIEHPPAMLDDKL